MKKALIGGLVAALVVAGSLLWWRGPRAETPEQVQYRTFLATKASGYSGRLKSERWTADAPFFRQGALQVHAGLAGHGKGPRRPVFLLLQRLSPHVAYAATADGISDHGQGIEISADQHAADGKVLPFKWRAEEKDPVLVAESFAIGGKPCSASAGRVFLIDLTAAPPSVSQHDADLEELFRGVGEETTTEEMKGMVERLSEWEPAVKDFLGRIPTMP